MFIRNFILFMAWELSASLVWCDTTCSDDIDEEKTVRDDWDYYTQEQVISIIKRITTNCQDATFPLHDLKRENCDDCPTTLKVVSLADTTSSVLIKGAIPEVPSYNTLILNDLNITKISPGAFGRQKFSNISLSGNKLTEIEIGTFNLLAKLQNINMSFNILTNLPPHCLVGLPELKSLNVSNNALTEFSFDIFDVSVNKMEYIDLSSNKISKLNRDNQIHVDKFYLSNNQIKIIEFCPFKFIELNLSYNILESLNEAPCDGDTNQNKLIIFDVSFNNILKLEQFYFKNASNLEYLYLNHNNISNIATGVFFNLINLKKLNLSENHLQEFQYGTFDSLENLITLDLSFNNIKSIKTALHALTNLKELYLHNNNIASLDVKQLTYDSNNLQKISFYNNNFSCDTLVRIMFYFRKEINVTYGNNRNTSNIHGIACLDTENNELSQQTKFENSDLEQIKSSVIKEIKNDNAEYKNNLKNYFDNGFKNSNFYKFMSNFQESKSVKLNDTELLKYFNNDFEKSKFYKYLESLKNPAPTTFQNIAEPQKLVNFQKTENTDIVTVTTNIIIIILIIFVCILNSLLLFLVHKILKKKFKSVRDEVELLHA